MAEEQDDSQKTEDPTQKRLEEARQKGDIAKSQDVPIWFLMMATAGIMAAAGPLAAMIADPLVRIMDHPHAFRLENGGALRLMGSLLMALAPPLMIIFSVIAVAGVLANDTGATPLTVTGVQLLSATSPSAVTAGTNSATGTVITGQYGNLTMGADGSYVYTVDNTNAIVQALRTSRNAVSKSGPWNISALSASMT